MSLFEIGLPTTNFVLKMKDLCILLNTFVLSSLILTGCIGSRYESADTDGDGKISESELAAVIVADIYAEGDTNQDGKMTLEEWKVVNPGANASKVRERDGNGDGAVSVDEIQDYAAKNRTFNKLFVRIDTDADGSISRMEAKTFRRELNRTSGGNVFQRLINLTGS
jgi:hypothetical protein